MSWCQNRAAGRCSDFSSASTSTCPQLPSRPAGRGTSAGHREKVSGPRGGCHAVAAAVTPLPLRVFLVWVAGRVTHRPLLPRCISGTGWQEASRFFRSRWTCARRETQAKSASASPKRRSARHRISLANGARTDPICGRLPTRADAGALDSSRKLSVSIIFTYDADTVGRYSSSSFNCSFEIK
jgi:hypothetical protein